MLSLQEIKEIKKELIKATELYSPFSSVYKEICEKYSVKFIHYSSRIVFTDTEYVYKISLSSKDCENKYQKKVLPEVLKLYPRNFVDQKFFLRNTVTVMPFIQGKLLKDCSPSKAEKVEKSLNILKRRLKRKNIIVGDLHDMNVIITKRGGFKIIDFNSFNDY